jgi:exodeoxyribonuclease V alpha subunit
MEGEWGHHPKYGEQFKIVFWETKTPATVYGIEKYLGSGLVKGIGLVMPSG